MSASAYFEKYWRGDERVTAMVETLSLAKSAALKGDGGSDSRGSFAAHMRPSAAMSAINDGTLIKVSHPSIRRCNFSPPSVATLIEPCKDFQLIEPCTAHLACSRVQQSACSHVSFKDCFSALRLEERASQGDECSKTD